MLTKYVLVFIVLIVIRSSAAALDFWNTWNNNACPSWRNYWTPIVFNSQCYYENDADLETPEIIKKYDFKAEKHIVQTDDGYLLPVYRVLKKTNEPYTEKDPLLMGHGTFMNSAGFLVMANESLPFQFALDGYDVWIANFRGTYETTHVNYTRNMAQFWRFSLDEMGTLDMPAMVNYVHNKTNKKVIYLGYSMGTTASYIYASQHPQDAQDKLKKIISLAPTSYWKGSPSLINAFYHAWLPTSWLYNYDKYNILPIPALLTNKNFNKATLRLLFPGNQISMMMLKEVMGLIFGRDFHQFSSKRTQTFLAQLNEAFSFETVEHYRQISKTDRFARFDYGETINLQRYNSSIAPEYNIEAIKVPMLFITGKNDRCSIQNNAKRLYDRIQSPKKYVIIEYELFCHNDYISAKDAPKLYINDLISTWIHFV